VSGAYLVTDDYHQLNRGTPYDGKNCGPWTSAAFLERVTLGAKRTTGTAIRRWMTTEMYPRDYDTTNLRQNAAALFDMFKVGMELRYGMPFDEAVDMLKAGRPISVSTGYWPFITTPWRGSFTYTGGHQILWEDYIPSMKLKDGTTRAAIAITDPLADGRYPGIAKGRQYIPVWLAERSAGELVISAVGDPVRRLGLGRVYAGIGRDTEPHAQLPDTGTEPTPKRYNQMFTYDREGAVNDVPPRKVWVEAGALLRNGAGGPVIADMSANGYADYYGRVTTGGVAWNIVGVNTRGVDGILRPWGGLFVRQVDCGKVVER
jgi:hypothetical protein